MTTNDRFVNEAWTKALEACTGKPSTLDMYSDGDGDLVKALGLVDDMGFGLGLRSKRFALVVEDGVVAHVATDPGMDEMRETERDRMIKLQEDKEKAARSKFSEEENIALSAIQNRRSLAEDRIAVIKKETRNKLKLPEQSWQRQAEESPASRGKFCAAAGVAVAG